MKGSHSDCKQEFIILHLLLNYVMIFGSMATRFMAPYKAQLLTKSQSQWHQGLLSQTLTPFSLVYIPQHPYRKCLQKANGSVDEIKIITALRFAFRRNICFPQSEGVPLQWNRNKLEKQHLESFSHSNSMGGRKICLMPVYLTSEL